MAELRTEVRAAELARRESTDAGAHEMIDRKDERRSSNSRMSTARRRGATSTKRPEVAAALQRLDTARYGDCVDCGEPISLQRLLVQPAAQRCAACQQLHEHASQRSR